jgi:hypothetical protein
MTADGALPIVFSDKSRLHARALDRQSLRQGIAQGYLLR